MNAKCGAEYTADGNALARILINETPAASASAEFEYHEDPLNSNDLTLHVHLYLVAIGGAAVGGDATLMGGFHAEAGVDDTYFIEATGLNDWTVSGNLPGIGNFSYQSSGGVNIHLAFELPVAGGVGLTAATGPDTDGGPWGDALDGIINGLHGLSAAAWAYVTDEGQDVQAGDFNADGSVNAADYDLWKNWDPRADADLDADVDNDDYNIWASNADVIFVSTEEDVSDADYSYGDLSLREALLIAYSSPGIDDIVFDPAVNEIELAAGELHLNSDVNIVGPGMGTLTVDSHGASRVFRVNTGVVATIAGMTITGGNSNGGGGVYTFGDLTLDSVHVVDNTSSGYGGGIYVYGSLDLVSSLVTDNVATSTGGAVYVGDVANATIRYSTIDGNEANWGGGIAGYMQAGEHLNVEGSTISNNVAVGAGGVLIQSASSTGISTATFTNSTISTNSATYTGGIRIDGSRAHADLINSTVAFNKGNEGGGIQLSNSATASINNTIVAENKNAAGSTDTDVYGVIDWSDSYNNLIGRAGAYGFSDGDTHANIVLSSTENAGLSLLDNYGGLTETHALLQSSQAINAGNDEIYDEDELLYLLTDQRGLGYERLDWGVNAHVDIGAFELAIDEMYT